MISLAKDAKPCKLENAITPSAPSLSEAEHSDVETFLEEMLLCFPVLGVTMFEKPELNPTRRRLLVLRNKGIHAEGYESEDGFVVKKDSTAVAETVPWMPSYASSLRSDLLESGVLAKKNEQFLELKQDFEFSSPSFAAAFLTGVSINGRDWWKTANGVTLKQLQEKSQDAEPD